MDYDSVVDELYALRPEDFTAARASAVAAARTAGDRELAQRIGTVRKPSLAAWVSNLLVRSRPDEVEPLLRLGEGLRQAHQDLDGTQLRELSRQQHALIRALSAEARRLAADAGHPVGEAVQREVENTLHAVLADPEAAQAWASARLAKPLSATVGFPAVAQSAAPKSTVGPNAGTRRRGSAEASSGQDREADEQRQRRLAQARRDAEAAERELRTLKDEAAVAGQDADEAKQEVDRLQRRVGELTEELESARGEHEQARFAERTARERARTADRRVREADRRAAKTAAQLERLTSADT
ncbi:hypothetical protein ABZ016_38110 [Streptomyces sp. NPDC006372]|uniref:hypothetical protein n=1 Tax=Streptomyces sp. NPDC006372 TaxID=3155599 RepID=UPI00339EAD3C